MLGFSRRVEELRESQEQRRLSIASLEQECNEQRASLAQARVVEREQFEHELELKAIRNTHKELLTRRRAVGARKREARSLACYL